MEIKPFFDPATSTLTYVVFDPNLRDAVIVDPVLDYDPLTSRTSTTSVEAGRLPAPRSNGRRYLRVPISDGSPIADVEAEFVAAHPDLVVIDVRESSELIGELGHIRGVRHVPLATIPAAANNLDREREIVLVCRSGQRSARAAAELARHGFRHLYNLRGGMLAWNAAHLPVER
jgi:rhodanese-related sulfurtransferase